MSDPDRGVSTTLSYVLSIATITLLISGIFIAGGDLVADQRERAIRAEFDVLGNRIASDLSAADRLVVTLDPHTVEVSTRLPIQAAGGNYRINVSAPPGGPAEIELISNDPVVSVSVHVANRTPIRNTTVSGGDLVISYDGSALEVGNG